VPRYHWKGKTAQGFKIEGDLEANSKESALEQLRRQPLTISEILETSAGGPTDTRPREERGSEPQGFTRFKSLFMAAMFAAAAVAVGFIAPITVWTCERAGGTVACSIAERNLGLIELRGQHLANVTSVDLETQLVKPTSGFAAPGFQRRLVFLDAKGGSIRSFGWDQSRPREWFQSSRAESTSAMFEEFQRFFADGTATRQSTWGAFFVPLILVGVFLLLSLLTLSITALSMFIRPEWARAQVEELAKRGREKRS
jgi:hypothetical protein